MKFIFKVIIAFVIIALLTLLVLYYLDTKQGFETKPAEILDDIKDAGKTAGESIDGFLEDTGIKDGAASLLQQGADMLAHTPEPTA
ncbi:MAG: hypothetical protein PHO41_01705 [Eubacteriales bacterium]|nr:hypothetical protein [Eubacteriales bacterium]